MATKRNRSRTVRQRRSLNLPLIIGGVVVALLIVVALIFANTQAAPSGTTAVNSDLAKCGQPTCGQANAPVTIDEYSDFQ